MDFGKKGSEQEASSIAKSVGSSIGQTDSVGTTLGEDTEFTGTMKFGKSLKIEGKFKGDLSSPGHLIVGKTGQVQAEVNVGGGTIEGKLTGNIHANDLVELRSAAEVFGDINASKIKIEEGVVFVGKAEIRPRESKSGPLKTAEGSSKPSFSPSAPEVIKQEIKGGAQNK